MCCVLVGCGFATDLDRASEPAPEMPSGPGAPDAGTTSPAPFDFASCPSNYVEIPNAPSRYRIASRTTFKTAHADCKDDAPGLTHVIVVDTQAEMLGVRAALSGEDREYYVAVVHTTMTPGWLQLTGGAVPDLWAPEEPDDSENKLARVESDGFHDEEGTDSLRQICECDGRPVLTAIETFIP